MRSPHQHFVCNHYCADDAWKIRELFKLGVRKTPNLEVSPSWSKIGVAFLHKDGKGLEVVLDALPVSGRVVLRISQPKPKKETD